MVFGHLWKILSIDVVFFGGLKWKISVLYHSGKTSCSGKIWKNYFLVKKPKSGKGSLASPLKIHAIVPQI